MEVSIGFGRAFMPGNKMSERKSRVAACLQSFQWTTSDLYFSYLNVLTSPIMICNPESCLFTHLPRISFAEFCTRSYFVGS